MRIIRCSICDKEHERNVRQYAHTYHFANTICLSRAFRSLPMEHKIGVLLHEIGHLLAGPNGTEERANELIYETLGIRIWYVNSPYGEHLEYVDLG